MMSDTEIISVVESHRDGKLIERCRNGTTEWITIRPWVAGWVGWNFENYDYRVAPEPRKPREWIVGVFKDALYLEHTLVGEVPKIRVREVIE